MRIEQLNAAGRDEVATLLRACLDVERWVDALVLGRPYATLDDLVVAAERVAVPLHDGEIDQALARHPRIGEAPSGSSAEARMSRAEQAGVGGVDRETADALRSANVAYEERFGRVFLVRAAGRSPQEILSALTHRLENPPEQEARVIEAQLREIAILRLRGTLTS